MLISTKWYYLLSCKKDSFSAVVGFSSLTGWSVAAEGENKLVVGSPQSKEPELSALSSNILTKAF